MLIVGLAGGTGSGKTTAVKNILEVFPDDEVIVIPQDYSAGGGVKTRWKLKY